MNISLTNELENLVHEKVASGMYTSASEVVREALRLLKEKDELQQRRLEDLRREIAVGLEQLNRGEGEVYDEHSLKNRFEEVKNKGKERLAERRKIASL